MSQGRLNGKVAIVTGAAQGIGAAYVRALAKEGAMVAVGDILDTAPIVAKMKEEDVDIFGAPLDVTQSQSVQGFVAAVMAHYGRIDILVNNAAIFGTLDLQPFTEITAESWDRVMAVNVRGSFECAKAVVGPMRDAGGGVIINIASGTVFKGMPNFLHYVTSKGAVVAMTRCLARELGDDKIRVNCIAPGLVMSDNVRAQGVWSGDKLSANIASRAIKREATPEDVLGTLVYLSSDDSIFVSGQTMVVDGGSVMN